MHPTLTRKGLGRFFLLFFFFFLPRSVVDILLPAPFSMLVGTLVISCGAGRDDDGDGGEVFSFFFLGIAGGDDDDEACDCRSARRSEASAVAADD